MRYKKIKRVPFTGNRDQNLILRQQYALAFIRLLSQGKRIINVDETNISKTDFRRKMWMVPKSTNSMKNPLVNPRVSLIAGIDTEGHIYISLI
mgnify:CR=1 FL=1